MTMRECSGERSGVFLMVPLELLRHRQRRFAEQTAFGTDLIGRDRLELGAERRVEDAHIRLKRFRIGLGPGR